MPAPTVDRPFGDFKPQTWEELDLAIEFMKMLTRTVPTGGQNLMAWFRAVATRRTADVFLTAHDAAPELAGHSFAPHLLQLMAASVDHVHAPRVVARTRLEPSREIGFNTTPLVAKAAELGWVLKLTPKS